MSVNESMASSEFHEKNGYVLTYGLRSSNFGATRRNDAVELGFGLA